ncbi:hypothetical protein [Serratia sp. D1N4]
MASLLCLVFLPFSPPVRWGAFLLVVATGVAGLWRAGRQPDATLTTSRFDGLPVDNTRLPVVLAVMVWTPCSAPRRCARVRRGAGCGWMTAASFASMCSNCCGNVRRGPRSWR